MDLKCCPFCGKIPDHYYSENDKGYVVECSCSARVISYIDDNHKDSRYFDEFNDLEDIDITKIRARDQWNSRSKGLNNWIITEDTLPKDDRQVLCLHIGVKPIYSIGYFHEDSWVVPQYLPKHFSKYTYQYWQELPIFKKSIDWINLDNTHPDVGQEVLLLRHGNKDEYKIAEWFWSDSYMEWLSDVGTHPFEYFQYWMKLPDCPEEQ